VETHSEVFTWVLTVLGKEGLLKGKTIGVDATTLEANAALRSIVRRDTGERYEEFLRGLAKASGIETPTRGDGPARTLYQDRSPRCRSLDAIRAIDDPKRLCALCEERAQCTPQIWLHLVFRATPYRILLAYTSAKNFLLYAAEIRHQGLELPAVVTSIRLLNRGTWGELRFARAPSGSEQIHTGGEKGNIA
jgi:hypothetical protein